MKRERRYVSAAGDDRWDEGAGLVGEDAVVGAGVASQRILQVGKG